MVKESERRLIDLITDQAEAALARQGQDGSMPAGYNGPYNHPETAVRNTAHWLITFSRLYQISSDQRYLDAADRFANYLADPTHRPGGFSFHCRNGGMDHCNGLIGQAWAMEGLTEASHLLGDDRYSRIALDVFTKHEFNRRHGLWLRLEPDGHVIDTDLTFNHQLWFAATAAELLACVNEIDHPNMARFMEKLRDNFVAHGNGRIYHLIYPALPGNTFKKFARPIVNSISRMANLKAAVEKLDRRKQMEFNKEVGYQAFTIYAFARLARIFDGHPIFKSKHFCGSMSYLESEEFQLDIGDNSYGFGYNAPGFEVPFCLTTFGSKDRDEILRDAQYWINRQIASTYNVESRLFDRNTDDPETLGARIYECMNFPDDLLLSANYVGGGN